MPEKQCTIHSMLGKVALYTLKQTMARRLLCSIFMLGWFMGGCRSLPPSPTPPIMVAGVTATPLPLLSVTPSPVPATPIDITQFSNEKIIEFITTTVQARLYDTYPSPDNSWQVDVEIYDCIQTGEQGEGYPIENAYEQLTLIDLDNGIEQIVASQFLYCGGLGAGGLAGLFWSENSRYFYYTDAREGVPDGCGYWVGPSFYRLEVQTRRVEYLGGGLKSPDGTMLATWQYQQFAVWDVEQGEMIWRPAVAQDAIQGPLAWSPDGTRLATWQDDEFVLWHIEQGETARLPSVVPNTVRGEIAWSPDSQSLMYLRLVSECPPSGNSYVVQVDVTTGEQIMRLASEMPTFRSVFWQDTDEISLFDENSHEWHYNLGTSELVTPTLLLGVPSPSPVPTITPTLVAGVMPFNAAESGNGSPTAMAAVRSFLERYELGPQLFVFVTAATDIQHWPLAKVAERYTAGPYSLVVDAQTGVVLEFMWNETPLALRYTPRLDPALLETQAYAIALAESGIQVEQLQLETGVKGTIGADANYFFRWWGEPPSEPSAAEGAVLCGGVDETAEGVFYNENGIPCVKLPASQRPYIQVGLTEGGQLISFVNAGLYGTLTALQETPQPTSTPVPHAIQLPTAPGSVQEQQIVSPDGLWVAVLDTEIGNLNLVWPDGTTSTLFPAGVSAWSAQWSPDSKLLLVVLSGWKTSQTDIHADEPPEIWAVSLSDDSMGEPQQLFQLEDDDVVARSGGGRVEIVFGSWSPNGRSILFWAGGGAAMRADGNAPFVLDATTGTAIRVADWALVNPAYHSWSPDGATLAMTVGGWRSAQANKWLNLVDVETGTVTTVVSKTAQIPGIVAWSPQGDRIAYAAVEALPPSAYINDDHCCPITFTNPDIAGRRIYLLEPTTGKKWRLNATDAFQDAPTWSEDGATLYYVERHNDTMVLMQSDPATGVAEVVAGSAHARPDAVGFYGQTDWREILAHRSDTPQQAEPALIPDPTPMPSVTTVQPITLIAAWEIAQEYAQAWSDDAALIMLNSVDVDDEDKRPRQDGSRRVWQAFYNSPSKNKELHLQVVDGKVTSASEDGAYDPGVLTVTVKPRVDSPAALTAAQATVPDFGMSVGRGKGFHFGLYADANGRAIIGVVGASPTLGGNLASTSITLDAATGEVIEPRVLPQ